MKPLVYDIAMGAGTVMIGTGAGMTWGVGYGLMAAGGCIIFLTIVAVRIAMRA